MENIQRNSRRIDSLRENDSLKNQNNSLKYILAGIGLLSIVFILYFAFSGESDYERGVKYLNEKQYSQAVAEFQKVDTDDSDFKFAQSKINYINGLNASTQGLNSQAIMFLSKVDPADEYYNESRLMIEKINLVNRRIDLENLTEKVSQTKDTLVIIDKTGEVLDETRSQSTAESSLTNNKKPLPYSIQKAITEFEKQFRLSEKAPSDNKKNYLLALDSLYNKFSGNSDPSAFELNKAVSAWMKSRLDFISKQIGGNSFYDTDSLSLTKEEGDKAYLALKDLLSQYQ